MSRPDSHPVPRRWDGTPTGDCPQRTLRVAADCPTRLLRTAQSATCRDCGNRIDWYTHTHTRRIALHPHELPAAAVPPPLRWHVQSGVAFPAGDGSAWCRIPHARLCPSTARTALPPHLADLRRRLAIRTRRLLDTRAFIPPCPEVNAAPEPTCRPSRPVVQILYGRYLAAQPIDAIQCVAQTRRRIRCTSPLLSSDAPAGTWKLLPATAERGQLALPAAVMALYDLSHLPYEEQVRWRTQRCTVHAATPSAADLALTDWEPFDPLLHHQHIHDRLPTGTRRQRREPERTAPNS
ncbi:DUF6083 domain-containing protein [Streptomyces sp. NPDC096176]|uniref:DUF6083 domain-containing protein n=1 Tax=Streptomyces sp. NPDC096176 TaxID=3366079 RepID=UPI00381329BA